MEKYLKNKKLPHSGLSDDELRKRIFANAAVLFPSCHSIGHDSLFEIVYASAPHISGRSWVGDGVNAQYAIVVRRDINGGHTPLIKGQVWAPAIPWTTVLQGLLDTTATMIHKIVGQTPLPQPGMLDELPRYTPPTEATQPENSPPDVPGLSDVPTLGVVAAA